MEKYARFCQCTGGGAQCVIVARDGSAGDVAGTPDTPRANAIHTPGILSRGPARPAWACAAGGRASCVLLSAHRMGTYLPSLLRGAGIESLAETHTYTGLQRIQPNGEPNVQRRTPRAHRLTRPRPRRTCARRGAPTNEDARRGGVSRPNYAQERRVNRELSSREHDRSISSGSASCGPQEQEIVLRLDGAKSQKWAAP
jgi:hypothetical protein